MKKAALAVLILAIVVFSGPSLVLSHCEIPCGVYGDAARITMLYENITTIEKSMDQILLLSQDTKPNWNQLVRWVTNKEEHSSAVQHIATQYFLTQRIKPTHPKYVDHLKAMHGLLVHAMKAKQTTDLEHVGHLRKLVADFAEMYFSPEDLKHIKDHHPEGKQPPGQAWSYEVWVERGTSDDSSTTVIFELEAPARSR